MNNSNNNRKSIQKHLPFLVILIIGTVYALYNRQQDIPFQKEEGAIFGTFYHVTYQCDSSIYEDIQRELQKVDNSLSPFNKTSVITKINNNEEVIPDSLFTYIFHLAKHISEQTNGAFDITVAPLVNAWGFGFKNEQTVTPELIDSLLHFVGFEKVSIDENNKVIKSDPRVMLDCSAIAKGYGSDVVARLFDLKGIKNYMIEIGGEIVTKGHNPNGKNWKVGINRPDNDSLSINNQIETILHVSNIGMATSGNYRNFYYKDGKKYAHTIDPHSGCPVQHSILSATVLAENCATADAYATAFMVLGLEHSQKILSSHPELNAYLIYTDSTDTYRTYMTEGVKRMIKE